MANLSHLVHTIREDDFVEYYVFASQLDCQGEDEQRLLLQDLLVKVNKVVEKYCEGYLWHKDPFRLVPRTSSSHLLDEFQDKRDKLPGHLHGVTHFGDNLEDEWFIVFILTEITREIPGSVVRVFDSDGEFLLIEAAEYLPDWANPESCENRVYIYEGKVHLVAPTNSKRSPRISIQEALQTVWTQPASTVAKPFVQNCIRNRLSAYPMNIQDSFHHATAYVPTALAAILRQQPQLISAAVVAFCNRDPVDLKACRAMKYFAPEQRVMTRIKFTKCLYAMLLHSKYVPERRTGWNLPAKNSVEYKSHLLGVKIACGFEILAAQAKPNADIGMDKGWAQYVASLTEKGYFKNLLEGSKEYIARLNNAKEYYIEHRDSMQHNPAKGQEILRLFRSCEVDHKQLQKDAQTLLPDDDESWLEISPEALDSMLQNRYGQKKIFKVDESTDPRSFAERIDKFMNNMSEIEGVEYASSDHSDDPPKPSPKKQSNQNQVNFDANGFVNALQNILNLDIPEDDSWDLEMDSDMSEYETDEFVKESDLNDADKRTKMQKYMEQMDLELSKTTVGQSFEKKDVDAGFEDIENFKPVDIDANALKNILESYRAQMGDAGPSSNMLGPMGVHLDPKK